MADEQAIRYAQQVMDDAMALLSAIAKEESRLGGDRAAIEHGLWQISEAGRSINEASAKRDRTLDEVRGSVARSAIAPSTSPAFPELAGPTAPFDSLFAGLGETELRVPDEPASQLQPAPSGRPVRPCSLLWDDLAATDSPAGALADEPFLRDEAVPPQEDAAPIAVTRPRAGARQREANTDG